jgi:chromosome segregation ATPase
MINEQIKKLHSTKEMLSSGIEDIIRTMEEVQKECENLKTTVEAQTNELNVLKKRIGNWVDTELNYKATILALKERIVEMSSRLTIQQKEIEILQQYKKQPNTVNKGIKF